MSEAALAPEKSILVQILNEVDEFGPEEKRFILYWLKTQKHKQLAARVNFSVTPNNFTLDDIYAERDAMRKEKVQ